VDALVHSSSPQVYREEDEGGEVLTGGNHERLGGYGGLTMMDSGDGAGSSLRQ
jgi:hypothetical protein